MTEIERQKIKERATRYDTLTGHIEVITSALMKYERNPTGSFAVVIAGVGFSMPSRMMLNVIPIMREEQGRLIRERDEL